ncbi:MAG: HutD family protein [Dongiaceae bacterium]
MKLRHLAPADYKRMPWKNGQGSTTELLAEPNEKDGFNWRLSIAEVGQSGPFSDFSGYDRIITLIEGAGMVLTFDGKTERRIDRPYEPLPFDGGWQTECRLIGGPLRDFNLMVARRWGSAAMSILRSAEGEACEIRTTPVTLLHVFDGAAILRIGDRQLALAPGDTLHLEDAPRGLLITTRPATIAGIYLQPASIG